MKKALLAVAALSCMGSAALAGPNAGGTLIAALSVGTVYCVDTGNYCGSSTTTACEAAVTTHAGNSPAVINIIAAFPGPARLAGLQFGITYTNVNLLEWGACGDFELPEGSWPASGTGTAVTWSTAQTDQLVETYWFAAYNYYGNPETFSLGIHPTQGTGEFADDDVPSNIDPIAGYGVFGFNAPGSAPCPGAPPGACCFPDGSCLVLLADECAAGGGDFQGEGTTCEGVQCIQPGTGACCIGADCSVRTQDDCEANGGTYQGDDTVCDPNPCGGTPVIKSTWGEIKNNYR